MSSSPKIIYLVINWIDTGIHTDMGKDEGRVKVLKPQCTIYPTRDTAEVGAYVRNAIMIELIDGEATHIWDYKYVDKDSNPMPGDIKMYTQSVPPGLVGIMTRNSMSQHL